MNHPDTYFRAMFGRLPEKFLMPERPYPWVLDDGITPRCFTERIEDRAKGELLLESYVYHRLYRCQLLDSPDAFFRNSMEAIADEGLTPFWEDCMAAMAERPEVEIEISYFFRTYWQGMRPRIRRLCFDLLAATHVHVLESRRACYRPEFAFLVSLADGFLWALPYRDLLQAARNGLAELEELYDRARPEALLPILYGLRINDPIFSWNTWLPRPARGSSTFMWEQDAPGSEGQAVGRSALEPLVKGPRFDDESHIGRLRDDSYVARMRAELGTLLGRESGSG